MERKCMIAMLDILGFRNLVQANRDSLSILAEYIFKFIREALHAAMTECEYVGKIPSFQKLQANQWIGSALFSDSLFMYAKQDTDEAVRNFFRTIGWFMFYTIREGGCRSRGAIAYGNMYIDPVNSIFIGIPLIEAYDLERSQSWIGVALTDSAVSRIPNLQDVLSTPAEFSWWLARSPIPLKDNRKIPDGVAINWTLGYHRSGEFDLLWRDVENSTQGSQADPDLGPKLENTKNFHRKVCRWCSSHGHKCTF